MASQTHHVFEIAWGEIFERNINLLFLKKKLQYHFLDSILLIIFAFKILILSQYGWLNILP